MRLTVLSVMNGGMCMKIGFIGAGKVGVSLGKYLTERGVRVVGYYSRTYQSALEAAKFTNTRAYDKISFLVEDSDAIFLAVPDRMISVVWEQLKLLPIENKIISHFSGSLSSAVFSDISRYHAYGYSIHPLFAVSDRYNSYKELSNSYFTIEGSPEKIGEIRQIFEKMGNKICIISAKDKVKYHAAAAIASNLVVGLIDLSEKLLMECGFERDEAGDALAPIVWGNIKHILNNGVVEALTGPIERGDADTIKKHLATISGNDRETYIAVSRQVLEVAKRKNKDRDYSKIEEILK